MNGKVFGRPKIRSGLFTSRKSYCTGPNEIIDLMEVVGCFPKLMAMWLTKLLKRPTNPGKVKITGKRVSKSVGIVWSYLPCEQWFLHRTQPRSQGLEEERPWELGCTGRCVVSGGRNRCSHGRSYPARTFFKRTRFHVTG